MASKPYNGYPSWNAWNVSLWLNNDEGLYRHMLDMKRRYGRRAAAKLAAEMQGERTPDGAPYSLRSITLAMEGL